MPFHWQWNGTKRLDGFQNRLESSLTTDTVVWQSISFQTPTGYAVGIFWPRRSGGRLTAVWMVLAELGSASVSEDPAPSASGSSYRPAPTKKSRRFSQKKRSPGAVVRWITEQTASADFEYNDDWASKELIALQKRTPELSNWEPPATRGKRRALFYNHAPKQREERQRARSAAVKPRDDQGPSGQGRLQPTFCGLA